MKVNSHRVLGVAGRRWAAVLACGDGAVISHWSAGAAWRIRPSSSERIDVSVGRTGRVRRPGIRLHCRRSLTAADVTRLDGLPITTPARTVLDLAASGLRGFKLEQVVDQAEQQHLDFSDLDDLMRRCAGQRPRHPAALDQRCRRRTGPRPVLAACAARAGGGLVPVAPRPEPAER